MHTLKSLVLFNRVVLAWLGLRGLLDSLVTVERLETWDLRDHKEIGYAYPKFSPILIVTQTSLCVGSRWNTRYQGRQR